MRVPCSILSMSDDAPILWERKTKIQLTFDLWPKQNRVGRSQIEARAKEIKEEGFYADRFYSK